MTVAPGPLQQRILARRRTGGPLRLGRHSCAAEWKTREKNLVDRNGGSEPPASGAEERGQLLGSPAAASMSRPASTVRAVVSTRSVVAVIRPTSPRDHRAR